MATCTRNARLESNRPTKNSCSSPSRDTSWQHLLHFYLMKATDEAFVEREEAYEQQKRDDQKRWQRFELSGESVSQDRATAWLRVLAQGQAEPLAQ